MIRAVNPAGASDGVDVLGEPRTIVNIGDVGRVLERIGTV